MGTSTSDVLLMVEDSPTVRVVIAALLSRLGWTVHEADGGQAGIEAARALRPDVVLLDLKMPHVDGFGVLEAVRADPELADVPVVIFTSTSEENDILAGLAAGAHDVVSKSASASELDARLRAALRTKRLADDLREAAYTDPLTGTYNRRALDGPVKALVARARRHGGGLGVVMLDIDHFKNINDTFGHETGDAVLVLIAQTLRTGMRPSDVLCRWAGDEFLIVVEEATPESLAVLCTRLVEQTRQLRFGPGGAERPSISVGAALARDGEQSIEVMLSAADLAMYDAKAAGRDGYVLRLLP